MPLADESRAIARLLQQRWQASDAPAAGRYSAWPAQRLLEPQPQPILIAAGDQREPRSGADRGVGIALKEPHASRGDAVDIRRGEVATSVTGHVGIAEVVSQNKDDVRRLRRGLRIRTDCTGRERSCPGGSIAQQSSTRHPRLPSHGGVLCSGQSTLSAKMSPEQVTHGLVGACGMSVVGSSTRTCLNGRLISAAGGETDILQLDRHVLI